MGKVAKMGTLGWWVALTVAVLSVAIPEQLGLLIQVAAHPAATNRAESEPVLLDQYRDAHVLDSPVPPFLRTVYPPSALPGEQGLVGRAGFGKRQVLEGVQSVQDGMNNTNSTTSAGSNSTLTDLNSVLVPVSISEDGQSYYIVLKAGNTSFRAALDTASADLWLVASSCKSPACAPAPKYQLSYQSPTFQAVNNNQTVFDTSFADGTTASGFVAYETVQISNLTIPNQAFGVVTSTNVSSGSQISGVLGLGFPRLSTIFDSVTNATPIFATMGQRGQLDYPLFGLSLTRNDSGSLTFGAVDGSVIKDTSLVEWSEVVPFAPFNTENNVSSYLQWTIPLTGLAANGTDIAPLPTYPSATTNLSLALLDVGTSGIFGPYQDVTRMFAQLGGARLVSYGQWAVPCDANETIAFRFGTTTFVMEPTDYLIGPAEGNPNLCLSWPQAMPPSSDGVDWQLGTAFLRTVYSIFSLGIDTKEPPMIGLYPLNNASNPVEPFDEVLSFFSSASDVIATTLPNFVLPTPTFSTPLYIFNTSIPAPAGEIVASGLATSTYSAALGTHHVNATAIPTLTPSPTLATFLITDPAGHIVTSVSTASIQSVTLGQPPGWNAATGFLVLPGRAALFACALPFLISFVATFQLS